MSKQSPRLVLNLPAEVKSEANQRGHWVKHHGRKRDHRGMAMVLCRRDIPAIWREGNTSLKIVLTRIKGPRQRDFDGDNLQSAFKAIRDGIADALGTNDGNKRLAWEYAQKKGEKPGVRIEIGEARECALCHRDESEITGGDVEWLILEEAGYRNCVCQECAKKVWDILKGSKNEPM